MIIAVWAVLIALLEFLGIFSKAFLALFACKCLATLLGISSPEGENLAGYHISLLQKLVVLLFMMTLCTIEPFSACGESAFRGASSSVRTHTTW
jgi:hypothetical protein